MTAQTPPTIDVDNLDWAMLDLPGPQATEAAAQRRRVRGSHVADRARARYGRRYYGRRWSLVGRARQRYAARRRQAAAIEALAGLLMSNVRPTDLAEARALVRRAMAR